MIRILPLLAVIVLSGCFSYSRMTSSPPGGTNVEVELTDAGASDLAPLVGPGVVSIRGRVTEFGPDTIRLAVESVLKRSGSDEYWSNEPLAISRASLASIATRKFSALRTGMLALTAIGGALIVRTAIDLAVSGSDGKGKQPPQ